MAKLTIKDPSTLRWHYTPTRELYEAALALSAEAREVLLMIVLVENMTETVPAASNVKWWKAKLGISSQKWKRTLDELVRVRIVSTESETVSTTFSHKSCVKVANLDRKTQAAAETSPHSSSSSSSSPRYNSSYSTPTPSPARCGTVVTDDDDFDSIPF